MEREGSEQQLYATSAAARELGLARQSLNRWALIYERVHGELPRGERHVRFWTPEAMDRVRNARLAVEEGRAVSIEAALRGFETPKDAQFSQRPARSSEGTPETQPPPRLLETLMGELHALREAVEDQNELLRDQAHRLERLEAAPPLPIATPDTSEKASLATPDSPESSAEDHNEGEDVRQTSTDRRVFGMTLPTLLMTVSITVTVISALYENALLLTASLVVVAISFLFSWYYYAKG